MIAVMAGAVALAGVTLAAQKVQIVGGGATFPNPIYSKWFSEYNKRHPDVRINYQPIGSGGGIRQLTNRTVFFGASDGPMTDEQLKAAPAPIVHLPTVLGGVVPAYNLPGVTAELRFTGPLLADIYLGKVKRWNDPALAKENPGVKLPANPADKERARIMVEFMKWALTDGQKYAPELGYAPLPEKVVGLELESLKK